MKGRKEGRKEGKKGNDDYGFSQWTDMKESKGETVR
jgi:hypothetical protein